ncbi:MAG: hypothetical protein JXQ90_15510 [Cyclobacteriaceae bacterium]
MGGFVKFKIILLGASISILSLIPFLKSNFNAPVTINKWRQLSWDDFQGFVKPFTGWGAGISSNVYLEQDSITNDYWAYAGQNNQQSWVKSSSLESEDVLNHEQYHFNITEYHSRLMNEELKKHPDWSYEEMVERLFEIRGDLDRMQDDYDNESDHNLNRSMQRRWEFMIDSMLFSKSEESFLYADYFGGAQVFFPRTPDSRTGSNFDLGCSYRTHELVDYGMSFAMVVFQYEGGLVEHTLLDDLITYYRSDSVDLVNFIVDSSQVNWAAEVVARDTVAEHKLFHNWIYNGDYLYKIMATYSYSTGDTVGYELNARSFINSIELFDNRDYWVNEFAEDTVPVYHEVTSSISDPEEVTGGCITYAEYNKGPHGFTASPIPFDQGLLIPYYVTSHLDSLVDESILLINDDLYTIKAECSPCLFHVPKAKIPDNVNDIRIGHFLKNDTIKGCHEMYYQGIETWNRSLTQ